MKQFIVWLVLSALGGASAGARADTVSATAVPGGLELTGESAQGAHSLYLNQQAGAPAWSDSEGNRYLSDLRVFPAVEVVAGSRVLYPAPDAQVETKTNATGQVDVEARSTNGVTVTWTVLPQRLGLRIAGTNATYTLRLRYATRGESCRVQTGQQVRFATAGIGALVGAPQLVVEATRTRALSVTPPAGNAITWQLSPLVYPGEPDYLLAEINLKPGQAVWLATAPIPAYDGPVAMGFFGRRNLGRASSLPLFRASLASARWSPGSPVTLTCEQPISTNNAVVAALVPVAPDDPAQASETGPLWYNHADEVTPALLPLEVTQSTTAATITAPATTPRGVYRLRVWIVPRDLPRPAVLGGPPGAVVGFFPGIVLDQYGVAQNFPMAETLVTVHPSSRGSLAVVNPALRRDFWRGEKIQLLIQPRTNGGELQAQLTVRDTRTGQTVAAQPLPLTGATEFSLATDDLAPGEYRAEATAAGLESYAYSFTIAPPRRPGMAMIDSPMVGGGIQEVERLGPNVWTDVMPGVGGYAPGWADPGASVRGLVAADRSLPLALSTERSWYDELARGNWLWLQGVQSRQLDFFFYHSIPEQVDESLRKQLVYAQLNQRFPSMLGLVFDYDLAGVAKATSWGAEWETFGTAGEKRTALLNARGDQYWKDAQAKGAAAVDEHRRHNLFKAGVIEDQYRRSLAALREHLPEQRHTSSVTADHAPMEEGQYLPAIYRPLDFRYIEVWNDQVYLCTAHDLQESFWTSLLRMEKPAGQPLWVTVPTAPQSGTHLRRALQVIGRGATGVGYAAEGGAGLSPAQGPGGGTWGATPSESNLRTAEVKLTSDMATRYGAFFNQFAPQEEVAILYSVSQGGWNFGLQSPVFFAYYTLTRLNRPVQLLTEDQVANGALAGIKALLLVHQTAPLPPATLAAIERFAAAGGKVIGDRDTTLPVQGLQRLADLFWHTSLWPANINQYHEIINAYAGKAPARSRRIVSQIQTFCKIDAIPATQPQSLLAALGGAGRQPLELVDGDALISSKVAGNATLVMVSNENDYPFHDLFTDDQLKCFFYRSYLQWGFIYNKDVRVPRHVTLRLRDDLAARPPRIYDVFAGRELQSQKDRTVVIDLATLQGRALLLTPDKLEPPTVLVGQRPTSDPRATIVVRSATPLPVRIRVGTQEVFRAATPAGSSDTFALGPEPQTADVEVTDLLTGRAQQGRIALTAPAQAGLEELPAMQVCNPALVQHVLASQGLAIYVDARQAGQLAAAQRLAARIPGAEVVFNPGVAHYVLDWDLPADKEAINERIRQQQLIGRRAPIRWNFQWMGPLLPATVWNRPAVVFGNAGNNRLIADLNATTLLPRPATTEAIGLGRAFIGVAGAPFWNGQNVVYALTTDARSTEAALEKLGGLGEHQETNSTRLALVATSGSPLAERLRQLGFAPSRYPDNLVKLPTRATSVPKPSLAPCLPVTSLVPTTDGVLVALGTPGHNLVRLTANGRERWRTMTAGFYQPLEMQADATGESVVRDDSFIWRHDAAGKLRWKMIGSSATPLAADGSVWVRVDNTLKHVSAAGEVLQSVECKDKLLAIAPNGHIGFRQRPGKDPATARVDSALVALELASGKPLWTVEQCDVAEVRASDDGRLLACIEKENLIHRDDGVPTASRLTVIEIATGRVRLRATVGQPLSGPLIAPDGNTVMTRGVGYSDALYLANLNTGLIRHVRLPEPGGWAHAFSRDGKTVWVACEKLYGVDVASLQVRTVNREGIVRLAAVADGLCAGTTDGRVLWLNKDGRLHREVALADGIGVPDTSAAMARLRAAKLVDSPQLRPFEIQATGHQVGEFPLQSTAMELRGDGIQPVCIAVHAVAAGKYRFRIPLHNAKTDGDKIGSFTLTADDGPTVKSQSLNGDKWTQAGTLDLSAGTSLISVLPINGTWQVGPLLRELTVEKAD